MNKGLLIVFEGIDGTGKSTQMSLLASSLKKNGLAVIETREPTNGQFGQQIRALYANRNGISREEELELFIADRQEHVHDLLIPGLQEGKIILCDRYFLSTAAYQGAVGFSPAEIIERNSFAPSPDLALLFCAPPKLGIERITTGRGDSLNDFEQEASLQKVAAIFDNLELPYIQRIDASGSIDAVHQAVLQAVTPLLRNMIQNA
ncbi:MAG: dTMP kinase [Proteobacteria bacterium]|jgi:dTMP kinase|nr:dTMP kinase [Desulfocapsa sp.]MBU3945706.1 dTMP kinase [Pseudomonadota bacterium]MCG2745029.1 dTMP kinase [Desulfobacteraceae bacterium]MDO8948041.1 dTMP kinase [Desulfocapsaceae bacterium]MBU3982853.1 dTMP kinase [Pseudomonadota bacterium]